MFIYFIEHIDEYQKSKLKLKFSKFIKTLSSAANSNRSFILISNFLFLTFIFFFLAFIYSCESQVFALFVHHCSMPTFFESPYLPRLQ